MINYFRMKKQEIQFKLLFYSYANKMIFKKVDIIKMVFGLVDSCKDKSPDDIKNEVIKTIAETVHADNGNDIIADKDAEIDDLKAQVEALSAKYNELVSGKK